ncbi:hypothetical protein [Sandaracinus amylolyticus]|uniref:hypothetical protein n=1 Tax=Sandaracinus amylolyticus TaxID=927083 RepID=UPI0012ED0A9D|nr:hypothetical protein [Sandaracinus amylolyticus]
MGPRTRARSAASACGVVALIAASCGTPEERPDAALEPLALAPSFTIELPPAEPATAITRIDAFLGEPDAPRITSLSEAALEGVGRGRGGRSVAFVVTLRDGTRGYFKPEQTFSSGSYAAEIAAYHLDRALGLGRVAPVVGRRVPWSRLEPVLSEHAPERLREVVVQPDGTVRGALVWWIPEALPSLDLGRGWERWIRLDGALAITPFQRPREYAALASGTVPIPTRGEGPSAGDPDRGDRAAELSDLVLFDYLAHNTDRWGGDFTNLRTREPGGPLVFLDHGACFLRHRARFGYMDARLRALQRFRRSTIDTIRALTMDDLRARLMGDPLGAALDETQLEHLEERRRVLLEHVDATLAARGDAVWLER